MASATQADLAKLFRKSQAWVSRRQTRAVDAMPKDMAGAIAWGQRLGLLEHMGLANDPPQVMSGIAPSYSGVEAVDIKLKEAKRRKIEMDTDRAMGELVPLSDVEAREARNAAEFRRVACEYPARARAVIERHVVEPSIVEKIIEDLKPLAADLLNTADKNKTLAGLTQDELRAVLMKRVEELLRTA